MLDTLLVALKLIAIRHGIGTAGPYNYFRFLVLLGSFLTSHVVTDLGDGLKALIHYGANQFDLSTEVLLLTGSPISFSDLSSMQLSLKRLLDKCAPEPNLSQLVPWEQLRVLREKASQHAHQMSKASTGAVPKAVPVVTAQPIHVAPLPKDSFAVMAPVALTVPVAVNTTSTATAAPVAHKVATREADEEIVLSFTKKVEWHAVVEGVPSEISKAQSEQNAMGFDLSMLAMECSDGHKQCSGNCAAFHTRMSKYLQMSGQNRSKLPLLQTNG